MIGIDDAVAAASKLLDDGLNKAFPDPQAKATAEATVIKAQNDAAIAMLQTQMSVMLAEAQSRDPWTSRARPSFMYVMYILMLFAVPIGIVGIFSPVAAVSIANGMKAWLGAIPDMMWGTFGTAYCGYTISRSFEKAKGVAR